MARVESVSKASRARSYMTFTLSMYCAGLAGSIGALTLTTGFGLCSQPRDSCRRCSRSRTLVKYWSSRLRSRAPTLRCRSFAWSGDRVEDAPARVEFADLRLDLLGRALQEQLLEHVRDAFSSGGIATPVPVHDRLRCRTLTASVSDGNRVNVPIRSAMCWSSEMVLRNELLAGCGAAVRKQMSDGWPPSTFGCDTPLNTVKSSRCSWSSFEVRRQRVIAAAVLREEMLRQQAEVVADAEHPARRGFGRQRR